MVYDAYALVVLAACLLAGVVAAHACTFAWLSREQKERSGSIDSSAKAIGLAIE